MLCFATVLYCSFSPIGLQDLCRTLPSNHIREHICHIGATLRTVSSSSGQEMTPHDFPSKKKKKNREKKIITLQLLLVWKVWYFAYQFLLYFCVGNKVRFFSFLLWVPHKLSQLKHGLNAESMRSQALALMARILTQVRKDWGSF